MASNSRSPMALGDLLKQERLRKGLELSEISRQLRISSVNLEAIESNRFEDLPGQFFAKSFLRQYSRYLGIYGDQVEQMIHNLDERLEAPPLPGQNTPRAGVELPPIDLEGVSSAPDRYKRLVKPTLVFLLVVAASSAVYVAWERYTTSSPETPAAVRSASREPAREQVQPPANSPAASSERQSQEASSPTPPSTPPVMQSAGGEGPSAPQASPPGDVSSPSASPVSLMLSARAEVWVRVVCDGQQVFQGLLNSGETKSFSGSETARLVIGNAGGLEVNWNGKDVGALGKPGQVRVVQFTPSGFEFVAPAAPKPESSVPAQKPQSV